MSKLKDVVLLGAGQAAAALGTLVGVRLLTHELSPETFGLMSMGLGLVALLLAALSTPLTQALMHLYPLYEGQGALDRLRDAFHRAMKRMIGWAIVPVLIAIAWCLVSARDHVAAALLLLLLLGSDVNRSIQVSVLSASKRHRRYSLWVACDAWLRPITAASAVVVVGESVGVAFAGHLIASLAVTLMFSTSLWGTDGGTISPAAGAAAEAGVKDSKQLTARLWQYAMPLIPVGVIAWSNSLSDRFIIGGMLDLEAAGIYAATFGLASAPFLMLTTVLELIFRPEHQRLVAAARHADANRQLRRWLVAAVVAAFIGVLAIARWRNDVVAILLGPQFRTAMDLMPWIAAGYALRTVAYALDRVCYAYGRTRRVLSGQLGAACATIVVTPTAIAIAGLNGAAIAVPLCFTIYLAATIFNAVRTQREIAPVAAPVDAAEPLAVRR